MNQATRPSVGKINIVLKNFALTRKLTKEIYVRFVFGIIVTTSIYFSPLLAKYFTHKKKSFWTWHLQLTRKLFARVLLAVCRGWLGKAPRVFFLCFHWVQWIKCLINLVKLSSDDLWIKWNIQSWWFREDRILWVVNTSFFYIAQSVISDDRLRRSLSLEDPQDRIS